MASTYTGLGIEKMTTGENAGTWGSTTNTNIQIIEEAITLNNIDYGSERSLDISSVNEVVKEL